MRLTNSSLITLNTPPKDAETPMKVLPLNVVIEGLFLNDLQNKASLSKDVDLNTIPD